MSKYCAWCDTQLTSEDKLEWRESVSHAKVGKHTSPVCILCFDGDGLVQCEGCYRLFGREEEEMAATDDGSVLCETCWEDDLLSDSTNGASGDNNNDMKVRGALQVRKHDTHGEDLPPPSRTSIPLTSDLVKQFFSVRKNTGSKTNPIIIK